MKPTIEILIGFQNVLDRGCQLIAGANGSQIVRVVSYLLRWHYGDSDPQRQLASCLATSEPEQTLRHRVRALLFCDGRRKVQDEPGVREFTRFGADVRHLPFEAPFRMVSVGAKLVIGINQGDTARTGALAGFGIYYEAAGPDPLIEMVSAMFESRFRTARPLRWDEKREAVIKPRRLEFFPKRFSLSAA